MPRKADSQKQTYSLDEIAIRWGCSPGTVLTHVYDGTLKAIDISTNPTRRSRYIVPADALEAFESARTVETTPAAPAPRRRRVRVQPHDVIEFIS